MSLINVYIEKLVLFCSGSKIGYKETKECMSHENEVLRTL